MDPKPNKKRLQAGLDAARAKEKKAMESARATEAAAKARREPKPKKLSEILEGRSGMGGEMRKKTEPGTIGLKRKNQKVKKMMGGGMTSKMSPKGKMRGGKKMPPGMMGGGMTKSKMGTKGGAMGGKKRPPGMKAGGKFPDLSGDGKVTQKDILMGKGVIKKKGGGKVKPKGAAAGGGYKKGGMKPKGAAAGGGYKKGGMKPKTSTKKRVSKPKVRGAGIARKGVRPVKYR